MPASYFESAMQTISEYRTGAGSAPLISSGYSKINLFGEEMVTSCGVAALALRTLRDAGIEVVLITTPIWIFLCLYAGENRTRAECAASGICRINGHIKKTSRGPPSAEHPGLFLVVSGYSVIR